MSRALINDSSIALTVHIVERINFGREELKAEAFRELLPVVRAGLEAYEQQRRLELRRLYPMDFYKASEQKEGDN